MVSPIIPELLNADERVNCFHPYQLASASTAHGLQRKDCFLQKTNVRMSWNVSVWMMLILVDIKLHAEPVDTGGGCQGATCDAFGNVIDMRWS